jgi:UDP-2-acetamido-3-amino-2,3-dideoxy-glucuronate N-acetyltransferase
VSGVSLQRSELAPGLLLGEGVLIGESVTIGGNAVIHAGVRIGDGARIGDHAQVRDHVVLGGGSLVGSFSSIDPEIVIGRRVSIQARCYIAAGTILEDDVFIGPGVTLTNDNTMDRHPPETPLSGPRLRRACRIGGGVVICPGVEIGEEAFVAAGALVVSDVPERTVVMGLPAREVRRVEDQDQLERWR